MLQLLAEKYSVQAAIFFFPLHFQFVAVHSAVHGLAREDKKGTSVFSVCLLGHYTNEIH